MSLRYSPARSASARCRIRLTTPRPLRVRRQTQITSPSNLALTQPSAPQAQAPRPTSAHQPSPAPALTTPWTQEPRAPSTTRTGCKCRPVTPRAIPSRQALSPAPSILVLHSPGPAPNLPLPPHQTQTSLPTTRLCRLLRQGVRGRSVARAGGTTPMCHRSSLLPSLPHHPSRTVQHQYQYQYQYPRRTGSCSRSSPLAVPPCLDYSRSRARVRTWRRSSPPGTAPRHVPRLRITSSAPSRPTSAPTRPRRGSRRRRRRGARRAVGVPALGSTRAGPLGVGVPQISSLLPSRPRLIIPPALLLSPPVVIGLVENVHALSLHIKQRSTSKVSSQSYQFTSPRRPSHQTPARAASLQPQP